MRAGKVFVNKVFAGILSEEGPSHYTFRYDEGYLSLDHSPAICLAMPKRAEEYESPYLFPFFSNMLSEGENRRFQSMLFHIDERDDFGILLETAAFDTPGAVTVIPIR